MLRILSFILLFILILWFFFRTSLREFFWYTADSKSQYSMMVDEALSRNIWKKGTGSVIFSQEDIYGTSLRMNSDENSYFRESEFNTKQLQLQTGLGDKQWNVPNPSLPQTDFDSLQGNKNFAQMNISLWNTASSGGNTGACKGLIFDPCLVLNPPEAGNGPWNLQASKTPIYNNIKQVPKSIF